jgi:hypothetical protein
MNTKLYEKLHEGFDSLEDVFKPMSDEDKEMLHKHDLSDEEKVIKHIRKQGAYQNDDGTWSCDGGVAILGMRLTKLPVRFKKVGGNFICSQNKLT